MSITFYKKKICLTLSSLILGPGKNLKQNDVIFQSPCLKSVFTLFSFFFLDKKWGMGRALLLKKKRMRDTL